jgi:hypothetical protein
MHNINLKYEWQYTTTIRIKELSQWIQNIHIYDTHVRVKYLVLSHSMCSCMRAEAAFPPTYKYQAED